MAITLAGIVLTGLRVSTPYAWQGVNSQVERSLGGKVIVWEAYQYGKPIDLIGGEDWGSLSKSILDSVSDLAEVTYGTYPLVVGSTSYTVRFRNEDAPAIEAEPIHDREEPVSADMYKNITIKLMEAV